MASVAYRFRYRHIEAVAWLSWPADTRHCGP